MDSETADSRFIINSTLDLKKLDNTSLLDIQVSDKDFYTVVLNSTEGSHMVTRYYGKQKRTFSYRHQNLHLIGDLVQCKLVESSDS